MITSKSCQLAIRALIHLTLFDTQKPISIDILHEKLSVGKSFLTKVLQPLTKAGILHSVKGTNGGVYLAKDPKKISVLELVSIIDGLDFFDKCMLGIPTCTESTPCSIHYRWDPIRKDIKEVLSETFIYDLVQSDGVA